MFSCILCTLSMLSSLKKDNTKVIRSHELYIFAYWLTCEGLIEFNYSYKLFPQCVLSYFQSVFSCIPCPTFISFIISLHLRVTL